MGHCLDMIAETGVFSFRRNTGNDGAHVTSSGRLLQTLEPAEANDPSPAVTRLDGRTSRRRHCNVPERSISGTRSNLRIVGESQLATSDERH